MLAQLLTEPLGGILHPLIGVEDQTPGQSSAALLRHGEGVDGNIGVAASR